LRPLEYKYLQKEFAVMTYAFVRITVEDFATWKSVFDESTALRKSYGSKGVRVFRSVDKPNEVVLVAEYENLEKARQLFQSQEYREAIKRAGVSGPPEVSFLNEVDRLSA
jgi:heme-degrading monooxygenase HmoA